MNLTLLQLQCGYDQGSICFRKQLKPGSNIQRFLYESDAYQIVNNTSEVILESLLHNVKINFRKVQALYMKILLMRTP